MLLNERGNEVNNVVTAFLCVERGNIIFLIKDLIKSKLSGRSNTYYVDDLNFELNNPKIWAFHHCN